MARVTDGGREGRRRGYGHAAHRARPSTTRTLLLLLPYAVMAVVSLADWQIGPDVGLLPLLALGPAFASVACDIRRTGMVGCVAVALCLLLSTSNEIGQGRLQVALVAIVGVTMASLVASAARTRHERRLADVQSVAEAAQRVLLRPVPRRVGPGLGVAVSYTSAVAEARIGGDLYEVVTHPRGVRVIVGDVQGKGLEAVETAAIVLGAFREAAYDERDLLGVATRLENALSRRLTGEQFVTAVLAEVGDEDEIAILNCGHPAPLIIRADGGAEFAEPPEETPPLGLAWLKPETPMVHVEQFGEDDQILLYTDGIIEARDHGGAFYPLTDRVHLLTGADPQTSLDGLRADLLKHVGRPLSDDAAMLLLRKSAVPRDTAPGDAD
ncbi:PP2C family protein-serine/threonine phosphatase [Spongiactinospora sp. TRM90649]|uniref:PP2C family protein-serine/threonine phosphatase n=1 Tax=Spongiactinospora sp. TRM90649 TaxID=3031114 RepID=UPI0023F70916|nr:PP2C family protein-serine/threonine phosphatase [Spongiactinospora sp. TRM90649]MDF5756795.1 PP2C family protein-serine/threonine phosphatase [Spongiactinospora sp. TRM90649]